jgi:hypothetical protein
VKQHKIQGDCDGIVDNTEFVKRDQFKQNESLVQRDYNFLINLDRNINVAKTDIRTNNKRILHQQHNRNKRGYKRRQVTAKEDENIVIRRGVKVLSLPQGMQRSQMNKTGWDKRKEIFVWTLEFVLVQDEKKETFVRYRVAENTRVKDTLDHRIKEIIGDSDWFCFLKRVKTKATDLQFIPLDKEALLGDALRDQTVIEFPTIIVSTTESVAGYTVYEGESDGNSTTGSDSSDSDSDTGSDSSDSSDEDDKPEEVSSRKTEPENQFDNSIHSMKEESEINEPPLAETFDGPADHKTADKTEQLQGPSV